MLFMPFEVTLNVHHQHFANSWNNKLFILKMFLDVRNSEFRRASVSPTNLHRSPPVFSYFARDILRLSQRLISHDL